MAFWTAPLPASGGGGTGGLSDAFAITIVAAETPIPAPTDAATFALTLTTSDTNAAPTEFLSAEGVSSTRILP